MSRQRPQLRGEQIVRLLERLGYHLVGLRDELLKEIAERHGLTVEDLLDLM